jgi:putative membrane protein
MAYTMTPNSIIPRREFLQTAILTAAGVTLITPLTRAAAGYVGRLPAPEFVKLNADAGAKMAGVKPDKAALSKDDDMLIKEIAMGGAMQLELSKVAVTKASSEDVRIYAQAEVDEQTGLSAKLKEIATAKGVALPEGPDDETKKMVTKLQEKSGKDFDRAYLKEVGVEGHEKLKKTMTKVKAGATDGTLKVVADLALPLIETHLQAAQDEMKDVG